MDTLLFFFKGVAAGFVIAAPVGPVGIMCVRRTLTRGMAAGYSTGLGASIADALCGIVAAYGISFIADAILEYQFWFRLTGGIVLCVVAMRTFVSNPLERSSNGSENIFSDFISAFFVTATNPFTLIAFGVVFAAIGAGVASEAMEWAQALIVGVFVGAALWWAALAGIASSFRGALSYTGMRWVNRISGSVILISGAVILVGALAPEGPVAKLFNLPFG